MCSTTFRGDMNTLFVTPGLWLHVQTAQLQCLSMRGELAKALDCTIYVGYHEPLRAESQWIHSASHGNMLTSCRRNTDGLASDPAVRTFEPE